MAFNVQEFRSSLQFDGARPSLFDVTMVFPAIVATGGGAPGVIGTASQQVTFKAKSSSLPGDSISSIPVNYFGREIKVAGTRTFPDWSFTVINDEDFVIRNAFERWMSGLNSHVGNLRIPEFLNSFGYQSDAYVTQYSKEGAIIKQYKLVGCFPTDVSAIDLDWASGDTIEEFAVTFSYQWWESIVSTDSSTSVTPFQTL
jgi:hypothetical protein